MNAGNAGYSPLVSSYNQFVAGHQIGPALPRPFVDFQGGAFGPLSPIQPMPIDMPGDSGRPGPRRRQYPVGWNLPVGQPGSEGGSGKLAPFDVLYKYADIFSVGRTCINIRRDEMAGLSWDIGPTADAQADTKGDRGAAKDMRQRAAKIVSWFKRIDSNYYGFQNWFTAALEQQIVIDALSLYLAPTRVDGKGLFGSDLAELQLLDGSTVRPLYDIHGARPGGGLPAYQQFLYGVPRSEYTAIMSGEDLDEMAADLADAGIDDGTEPVHEYRGDQLLYLPRLPRISSPYGFSPVEQALVPITLGMMRQNYLIDYYQEGSIPGQFVIAGDQYVTPAQQRQLQDTLNAIAGDTAWKHRIIVLPPGSKSEAQKNMDGQFQLDQVIAEQVAMIMHVQPHEIGITPGGKSGGLGGKGVAEQQQSSVAEQRTEPDRKWWKESCFDLIIQQVFGQEDLEWKWIDFENEKDENGSAQTAQTRIFSGQSTIDQELIEQGKDAFGLPLTQTPLLILGSTIYSLDPNVPSPVPPAAPAPGGLPGGGGDPASTALTQALQPEPGKNPDKPKNDPASALLSDKKKDRKKGRKVIAERFADNLKDTTKHPPVVAPADKPGAPTTATQTGVKPVSGAVPTKKKNKALAAPEIVKYSDDQVRDEHGRWASAGSESSVPEALAGQRAAQARETELLDQGPNLRDYGLDHRADYERDMGLHQQRVDVVRGARDRSVQRRIELFNATKKSMTVADLVKGRVKYKDSKLPEIVSSYLLRSYPAKDVEWATDKAIAWEFDPHVKLADINMARRPGGRDPKKVESMADSLGQGASLDPVVLVEFDTPDPAGLTIADGWHRTLGAEKAGLKDVPAFVGKKAPNKYQDTIAGAMQDDSDSKKVLAITLGKVSSGDTLTESDVLLLHKLAEADLA